jgi:hypothetical protein
VVARDLLAGEALTPERLDLLHRFGRGCSTQAAQRDERS